MRTISQCCLTLVICLASHHVNAKSLNPVAGFWDYWGDGKAEVSVYDLVTERYGQPRKGYAISIVVSEPWNLRDNVKSNRPKGKDIVQALKLNLIRHFQTGIYDYHTMTSAFIALEDHPKVPKHSALKLTFSAQEWCGQAFQVLEFSPEATHSQHHSYFEQNPKSDDVLQPYANEDQLWLWVRGFQNLNLPSPLFRSTYDVRIHHQPLEPLAIEIERAPNSVQIHTPRGSYTFQLAKEPNAPIQGWSTPWNERASLRTTLRVPYWRLNSARGLQDLLNLGLNSASSRLKRSP